MTAPQTWPQPWSEIFVYLAASPLLGLTVTLLAYLVGDALHRRSGRRAAVNPVLVAVALIAGLLALTETPYRDYFEGAQFVHFLLGPATVALAVPLYRQVEAIRRAAPAVAGGVVAGALTAAASAAGTAWLLGADRATVMSLAPKSVTTPIAMGIAEQIGGLPSLTAVLVILTGVLGAAFGGLVLTAVRVRDPRARGLAFGVAAHGIGTAQAFGESERTGAFASLGLGLGGLATAVLLPLLIGWW
ncbi:MAG TPA: LrgB family protein [Alphaproteobacteria bacterium]|nr:LrgB family protein [Alphaproteobacteria bacterium]